MDPDDETTTTVDSPSSTKRPRRLLRPRFSLRLGLLAFLLTCIGVAIGIPRLQEYWNRRQRMVPTDFDVGTGRNILWSVPVGSQSYVGPRVHDGKVYVGTNNARAYLRRYPATVDLGVLLCFDAADGSFLWQASSGKLPTGRVHDWPLQGIVSTPCFEGDRLWYLTNRCELVCLDTEGFLDREDDGDEIDESIRSRQGEADIVWKLDLMSEFGVSPHNCSGSNPCIGGDVVYVVTGNALDETHVGFTDSSAPSFIAVDKTTGKLLWQDNSPGRNVLHGQWGSPVYGFFGGVPQVIFPGGDGWLYGFDPLGNPDGSGKLLWKFDCNPKTSKWMLGGRGTRNNLLGPPTIHDGLVYMATGQDPEHGDGEGRIWCIDPTRRGDVSPELVFNERAPDQPIEHKRIQACVEEDGDFVKPNPNSAAVWEYTGNGRSGFENEMHRSLSRVVIEGDLLFVADYSGILHCVDCKTGKPNWTHDLFAMTWTTPVVSAEHVIVGDEDGDVEAFGLSADRAIAVPNDQPVTSSLVPASVYGIPVIKNRVLYLLTKDRLYAISSPDK